MPQSAEGSVIRFDDGCETVNHFPGSTGPAVSLRETVEKFERELPELNPASLKPIPTGFPQLDANTEGGLHAEDLIPMAGNQNAGKTLFVSQVGRNIARWAGRWRNQVVRLSIPFEHSEGLRVQRWGLGRRPVQSPGKSSSARLAAFTM
jgi:replicative DNA helicase